MALFPDDIKLLSVNMASTPSLHDLSLPQVVKVIAVSTLLLALLPLLLHLRHEYYTFLALGPGGTPKTLCGFLKVTLLSLFALRDPYTLGPLPACYANSPGYLTFDLPRRKGHRPETRGIAPHRQINQRSDQYIYDRLATLIQRMARDDPATLEIGTSCFEQNSTGLFITSQIRAHNATARTSGKCKREICHAHPSDGSMHVILHPVDAKIVLERGRGERHPLARGGWFERFVPGGFVMIYAPQDEAEAEVVLRIVEAAAWFVSGGVYGDQVERRDSGYVSFEPEMEMKEG